MKTSTRKLTLSALFLALGLVLPLITGQIPQIGKMLLPMHIPVLLCGMVCGWPYGLAVGAVMPLLRGLLFGMPVLYPTGIGMAFELAAYGAVIGLLYAKLNKRGVAGVYMALVPAMLAGRAVPQKGLDQGRRPEAGLSQWTFRKCGRCWNSTRASNFIPQNACRFAISSAAASCLWTAAANPSPSPPWRRLCKRLRPARQRVRPSPAPKRLAAMVPATYTRCF